MNKRKHQQSIRSAGGMTLVELMVALAVGSFLIIGAVQVYNQSRQAYVVNDSIARVQETAQFALDTIEADLRMASNFGRNSRGDTIVGRATTVNPNPSGLAVPVACGLDWALDVNRPVEADNNVYGLACPANNAPQANSDTITVRRATVAAQPLENGRLQIQSTRLQGQLIDNGVMPAEFDPLTSQTHNLIVNSYYVDGSSTLIPGVPTLRRHTLGVDAGGPVITDIEIAPGVENLQIQFGIDMNDDNAVDRYVDPDDPIINPLSPGWVPTAKVMTARVWLIVRSITPEIGIVDNTDYRPGDVIIGVPNDEFRRMLVSKTILLRNART